MHIRHFVDQRHFNVSEEIMIKVPIALEAPHWLMKALHGEFP